MNNYKEYLGELIGTFILVLFGCGSIASALFFNSFGSLLEIALIWGFGVAIAIFATRNICPAHLNPAVSFGMALSKKLSFKKLPIYIISQTIGAFLAGLVLHLVFKDMIVAYELANNIIRGSESSINSAMMFGEYFPNPGFSGKISVSPLLAMFMEGFGTFILVFMIFRLTNKHEQVDNVTPLLIGLTVTSVICLVAPFTQAGINPARDFGPRMVAYIFGWGQAAFPAPSFSFLTVYIIAPMVGGAIASLLDRVLRE